MKKIILLLCIALSFSGSCENDNGNGNGNGDDEGDGNLDTLQYQVNYTPGGVSSSNKIYIYVYFDNNNIFGTPDLSDSVDDNIIGSLTNYFTSPCYVMAIYDADANGVDSGDPYEIFDNQSLKSNATAVTIPDGGISSLVSISFDATNTYP